MKITAMLIINPVIIIMFPCVTPGIFQPSCASNDVSTNKMENNAEVNLITFEVDTNGQ